jgi:hypothetical protein
MAFGSRGPSTKATCLHINVLESTAMWIFLDCVLPKLSRQSNILWRVYNTTALAYVKKEGGTCSPQVLEIAEKILVKAHQMSVCILPVFIPTGENILAETASPFQEIPDWQLHTSVFRAISARWGPPTIDLFTSRASKQTQCFFSWDASDIPEAVDALSQKWDFTLAYAFPPIPLLKRVVKKLETSKGTFILVSPLWEAQTWLASLLMLKVLEVRRLPFMDNVVIDLTTGKPPPILTNPHLVAWRVFGGSTPSRTSPPSRTYLVAPEISTRQGGAPPQKAATKEPDSLSRDISVPPAFHSIQLV